MRTGMRFLFFMIVILCFLPVLSFADEVLIASVDATSWIVGRDPDAYAPHRMIDEDETTAFQFSTRTTPLGKEYIVFYLGGPSSVSALQIKNGFWRITDGKDQYVRNSRVKTMTVDFQYNYADKYSDACAFTLPDDKTRSSWTQVPLGNHEQVTAVRFLIQDIYPGSKYETDVCISEVRFSSGSPAAASEVYGLAVQKLATRRGPGTQYSDGGTYNVAGKYIRILSRAWDERNQTWWVKCEIPYKGEIRVLWTGYKRFDSSTAPLDSIPMENAAGEAPSSGNQSVQSPGTPSGSTWQEAYFQFVSAGLYRQYIHNANAEFPEFSQMLEERDTDGDSVSLYDLNRDGIPELLTACYYGIEQADVFTFSAGKVVWLGTMGGDNFFQDIFFFPGSAYSGLFAAMGGPVMDIRRYTFENGQLLTSDVGRTQVNDDGDETVGIEMKISDGALHSLLYQTFVNGWQTYESLRWERIPDVSSSGAWNVFLGSVQE